MPIVNVRVQHRFGIISQKQRVEIQRRLLNGSENSSSTRPQSGKSQLESLEDFAGAYSACEPDERGKYDELARSTIETVKRAIGYRTGGIGGHVNLPFGWTKLTLLAQCEGWIQTECLALLLRSMDSAPLSTDQVPVLIYIAELMLYLLRSKISVGNSDSATQSSRIAPDEIKLLKTIELALFRLYYFKLKALMNDPPSSESAECTSEQLSALKQYLTGLDNCEQRYSEYPVHEFCFTLILELGDRLLRGNRHDEVLPLVTQSVKLSDAVRRESDDQSFSAAGSNTKAHSAVLDAVLAIEREYSSMQMTMHWFDAVLALRFLAEPCSRCAILLDSLQRYAAHSLQKWTTPVVYAYCEMLLNVALNGVTMDYRQRCLLGFRKGKSPQDALAYFTNANLREKVVSRTNELYSASSGSDGDLVQMLIFGLKSEIARGNPDQTGAVLSSETRITDSYAVSSPRKVRAFALYCTDALRCVALDDAMKDGVNRFTLALLDSMKRYELSEQVLRVLDDFNIYTLLHRELTKLDTSLAAASAASVARETVSLFSSVALLLAPLLCKPVLPAASASKPTVPKKTTHKSVVESAKLQPPTRPCNSQKPALSLRKSVDVAHTLSDESKPDFASRTNADLRRVIEDQWRKELHRQLEAERNESEADT